MAVATSLITTLVSIGGAVGGCVTFLVVTIIRVEMGAGVGVGKIENGRIGGGSKGRTAPLAKTRVPGPKLDNCDDPGSIDDLTCEDTKGVFTNNELVNTGKSNFKISFGLVLFA